jgi:group I intron endonuclease
MQNLKENTYIPAKNYENADIEKAQILSDNNGKSGIYMWKNRVNGQNYVGSATDLKRRLQQYFYAKYLLRNPSMHICNSLFKNGYSVFSLEILEYCSVEILLEREKYYIDLLLPEYNVSKEPTSPMLGRIHSEETRANMSAAALGRTFDDTSLAKMSTAKFGNTHSNSKNHPNSIKLEVTDLEKNISTIFNSIGEAARALNIAQSVISGYLIRNQKKPYRGRFLFTKKI